MKQLLIKKRKKTTYSKEEITDLVKAWLVISLAFAIVLSGPWFSSTLILNFIISLTTVGIGFIFHELAHKIVAQKYGCIAEFRANNMMLGLALITSFFGIIFAAPGAVYIGGFVSKKRNGIISLAGPLTNMFIAMIFLITMLLTPNLFISKLSNYGFIINSWLALFNLIPISVLDGKKVINWNKTVWAIALIIGIILTFIIPTLVPSFI